MVRPKVVRYGAGAPAAAVDGARSLMAITDLDPKLLVEAHNDGDDDAFAQIVRTHHQGLFTHAVSRLHDVAAAEDAVQETFVRAYRAMPRFQGEFHLRAWLHRILTNVCHDEGSRRQRDGLMVERVSWQAALAGDPADIDIDRIDASREVVATALAELPVSYREALLLRYVSELSYEEVAAATGVTEGNARVRVMRGRVALKRALTASHAVVIGLLPWLRRGGRGPAGVADLSTFGTAAVNASAAGTPNLLASSPLLLRAVDTAPQLAERIATLPQVLGLLATMAVPIAAPVVSDQVADWVSRPPAISAEPVEVAAADGPAQATGPHDVVASASSGAGTAAVLADPTSTSVVGGAASDVAPATTEAPATTTSAPVTTTTTASAPAAVGPPTGGHAAPAPVPLVPFTPTLQGDQVTSVGDERTELAGAVRWDVDGATSAGDLRGTLTFDRSATAERPQPKSDAEEGAPADDAAAAPADPRHFSGALTLALEDGRTYRLVLTDGLLDAPGTGTTMSAAFELRDACDGLIASGGVTGELDLQEAPVPSALALAFDGEAPAEPPTCD